MNGKRIITNYNNKIVSVLFDDGKAIEINAYNNDEIINNIYVGRVRDVVKYLNAAFIEYSPGKVAYVSLDFRFKPFITKKMPSKNIVQGDEVIIQITKDAIKTKDPVASFNFSFCVGNIVLTHGKNIIGFSNKISDNNFKARVKERLSRYVSEDFGFIVRTNASYDSLEDIEQDVKKAIDKYQLLVKDAVYRTGFSILDKAEAGYISEIRNTYNGIVSETITDCDEIYNNICEKFADDLNVTLYNDKQLPLYKLYSIEKTVVDALKNNVWLKSGAYLVIEPTEALTVIDVNSGKISSKKDNRKIVLSVNMEAATEIAHSLRLRNITGIVVIDFINMEFKEDCDKLLIHLKDLLNKDPIKSTVVDMTALGLVEVTRKKIKKTLKEQFI